MNKCNCKDQNKTNIACNLSTISSGERAHYHKLRKESGSYLSVEETLDGYTFCYPNRDELLINIAEWISYENKCCPFIHFSLQVSGESETITVELTGNETVKNLIKEEFRIS
ncbi:hypothetical protein [Bacillus sp. Marseille-Q3570]|uniref:hypothetical protein n=1 Tax=Bacillus sp. Marseille-Q3570 TaxID=2963522 RepID=UPI0021B70115|nr:hypothetical protein [Bacillus sp. Marseille-Q3570]